MWLSLYLVVSPRRYLICISPEVGYPHSVRTSCGLCIISNYFFNKKIIRVIKWTRGIFQISFFNETCLPIYRDLCPLISHTTFIFVGDFYQSLASRTFSYVYTFLYFVYLSLVGLFAYFICDTLPHFFYPENLTLFNPCLFCHFLGSNFICPGCLENDNVILAIYRPPGTCGNHQHRNHQHGGHHNGCQFLPHLLNHHNTSSLLSF